MAKLKHHFPISFVENHDAHGDCICAPAPRNYRFFQNLCVPLLILFLILLFAVIAAPMWGLRFYILFLFAILNFFLTTENMSIHDNMTQAIQDKHAICPFFTKNNIIITQKARKTIKSNHNGYKENICRITI